MVDELGPGMPDFYTFCLLKKSQHQELENTIQKVDGKTKESDISKTQQTM